MMTEKEFIISLEDAIYDLMEIEDNLERLADRAPSTLESADLCMSLMYVRHATKQYKDRLSQQLQDQKK